MVLLAAGLCQAAPCAQTAPGPATPGLAGWLPPSLQVSAKPCSRASYTPFIALLMIKLLRAHILSFYSPPVFSSSFPSAR